MDLGIGFVYHLAQGIAFDPWLSYGGGFRSSTYKSSIAGGLPGGLTEAGFLGVDVARIALGGTFYPLSGFGFGPYFEADIGANYGRPKVAAPGSCAKEDPSVTGRCDPGASAYAFFQIGVRIALDPLSFGGGTPARSASARR
jgi:hypothetical protein